MGGGGVSHHRLAMNSFDQNENPQLRQLGFNLARAMTVSCLGSVSNLVILLLLLLLLLDNI